MKIDSAIESLNKDGYFIINEYLDEAQVIELRNELDNLIKSSKHLKGYWRDAEDSDNRFYGIDRINNSFIEIFNTEILNQTILEYLKTPVDSIYSFVLGNRIITKEGNKGSGGGWHRDTFLKKQLKFILYLSDVTKENGPFTYINGSHKIQNKIIDLVKRPRINPRRYPNYHSNKEIELTGKAGTLIIADTSGIHRGKPIDNGSRHALTLYINEKEFGKSVRKILYSEQTT